jgi:hypothetical protein
MIEDSTIHRLLRAQRAGFIVVWIDRGCVRIGHQAGDTSAMRWRYAMSTRSRYTEAQALRLLDRIGAK